MVNKFRDVIKKKGVRESSKLGHKVGILAPHGGQLDIGTAKIAEGICKQTVYQGNPATMYLMESVKGDPRKHRVPSTKISHTHSKPLSSVINHCKYNISIHGHSKPGHEKTVYVGGENAYMRKRIAASLKQNLPDEYIIEHDITKMPRNIRGTGRNIVNRSKEGGVQVELPMELRKGAGRGKLTGLSKKVSDAISSAVKGDLKARPDLLYKKGKEYKDDYAKAA